MALRSFILFILVIAMPHMAWAASDAPKKLGNFESWEAYQAKLDGHSTCYMIARPAKMDFKVMTPVKVPAKGKTKKTEKSQPHPQRTNVYLMITFRPNESMNPVVSYRAGYVFKQGSEVLLSSGDKPFNLFTDRDQAWARSGAMDIQITDAIRKSKRLTIQGGAADGGKSTDTFNSGGAENAYKAIVKACGIT